MGGHAQYDTKQYSKKSSKLRHTRLNTILYHQMRSTCRHNRISSNLGRSNTLKR